jgi:hypothetical protein
LLGNAACLAQTAIGTLPLPVYASEFLAVGEQNGPENIENALLFPSLKGAMHAAVIAERFGQLIPLAAGSHPEEDAVEGFAGIDAGASGGAWRIVNVQHRLDNVPEGIRNDPDGWQSLGFFRWLRHDRLLE